MTAMRIVTMTLILSGFLIGESTRYTARAVYQADDQGNISGYQPYSGWLEINADGTYRLQFHISDQGRWRLMKADETRPHDTIVFQSGQGFQFFAHPQAAGLAVWLRRNPDGTNLWVQAVAAPPAGARTSPQTAAPATGNLISNGRFTRVTMYGDTSAPNYYYQDRATGDISHDDTGIVLRPDGSFSLRKTFGTSVSRDNGVYSIQGNMVHLRMSDGSVLSLVIVGGGRKLEWHNQGVLLAEYFYWGTR